MELQGKYGTAKVYTDVIEQTAISQIIELLNQPFADGANVRIMPDVHAGKGCTIGTTMKINGKVCPNLVGVDIGCGVLVVRTPYSVELMSMEDLDKVIREFIPSGFSTREEAKQMAWQEKFLSENLNCWDQIKNKERIYASLGTLGGGNHFIELNKDREGKAVLVIHTGSRNLGTQVAKIYQDRAIKERASNKEVVKEGIAALKAAGRQVDIAAFIAQEKAKSISVPDNLAYLQGQSMREYLEDMAAVQEWAWHNREQIANIIFRESWSTDLSSYSHFQTVHNFIDKNWVLRKGAVSADTGEHLIIPLNMRDGSLLCVGRGNEDWNKSAPHGAGRLMSRGQAKRELSMADFTREMSDVYSTSVSESTLDEAPMAYKDMESIVSNIGDTVHIIERIVPVYNFKASDVTD